MAKVGELDINNVISDIIEGMTFRAISQKYNKPLSTLHDFLSKPEHSARVKVAQDISADSYSDKAEQILIEAEGSAVELTRARELAQHYRWKAAKRSPKRYGEKIDVTSDDKPIGSGLQPDQFQQLLNIAKANAAIPGQGE